MARPDKERVNWSVLRNPTVPLVLGAGAASLQRQKSNPNPEVAIARNEAPLIANLTGDLLAAFGASAGVSPFITIADRAIIQNASGAMKLGASMKAGALELLTRPHVFVNRPEFRIILGVYFSTYAVANSVTSVCVRKGSDPLWPRFAATSAVNVTASVAKDAVFTRMFGITKPKPLPISTLMLFAGRDCMTIAASFNFPEPASRCLQDFGGVPAHTADLAAQMACPPLIQLLSTPLYLFGLDLYNRPVAQISSRLAFVGKEYWGTVLARWARVAPAYSIGGVVNQSLIRNCRSIGL